MAVESADVVLVRSDPRDVAAILGLSRATYRKMVQNLIWATGYNAIAIPMAAGITFGTGFLMTPGRRRRLHVGQHRHRRHQRAVPALLQAAQMKASSDQTSIRSCA